MERYTERRIERKKEGYIERETDRYRERPLLAGELHIYS